MPANLENSTRLERSIFIPTPKKGTIKDRKSMDLTEAANIKKWWQEYIEEVYKKDLNDPDNYDGVITHLEPDIGVWSQVALRKHH